MNNEKTQEEVKTSANEEYKKNCQELVNIEIDLIQRTVLKMKED